MFLYIVEKHHLPSLIGKVDGRVSNITYYLRIETPQSAKAASSTRSGAKGLVLSCTWKCYERVVCRGEQCSPDNNRWLTIIFIYNEQANCRGEHCSSTVTVTNNHHTGDY